MEGFGFLSIRTVKWLMEFIPLWALAADDSQPAKIRNWKLVRVKCLLRVLFSFLMYSVFSVLCFDIPCE